MAASVGDTVEIYWRKTGRHDTATVVRVVSAILTLRITGPPDITMMVSADQVREIGPHHWQLDL